MLEGKNVNLRVMEKEDLPLFAEWLNNPEVFGQYNPLLQLSKKEVEKNYDDRKLEQTEFIIEKKVEIKSVTCGILPIPFQRCWK